LINPSEIVDALVTLLRSIPDLVEELGGNEENIFAYHDRYPKNISIEKAKYEQPSPSVMAVWQGTGVGNQGSFTVWKHSVSLFLRSAEDPGDDIPTGYYTLYRLILKGVPESGVGEQPMIYQTVHASCTPMDDVPSIQRQSDASGIDYFEITLSFTEIGDD
jgi:hypothetical protein